MVGALYCYRLGIQGMRETDCYYHGKSHERRGGDELEMVSGLLELRGKSRKCCVRFF